MKPVYWNALHYNFIHTSKRLLKFIYPVSFPTLALYFLDVISPSHPCASWGLFFWPNWTLSSLVTWVIKLSQKRHWNLAWPSHSSPQWLPLYPAPSKINHLIFYQRNWNTWFLTIFTLPFSWVTHSKLFLILVYDLVRKISFPFSHSKFLAFQLRGTLLPVKRQTAQPKYFTSMPHKDEQDAAGATIWGEQVEGRDGYRSHVWGTVDWHSHSAHSQWWEMIKVKGFCHQTALLGKTQSWPWDQYIKER